ncbi:MAG: formate dehydrogenase accessory sulfurtransferase FdhD [Chitinophagaceae bacterium]|nr:formate dehydrogenase accessory sulfurtransferase FdhD [Chitinophagaceae bacterium]
MSEHQQQIPVWRVAADKKTADTDWLAVEEPLLIKLGWTSKPETMNLSVTMRTPGDDAALAAGFLFTEGIIDHPDSILSFIQTTDTPNEITVVVKDQVRPALSMTERNFYTSSSCGVCGKSSLDAIKAKSIYTIENNTPVSASLIRSLPDRLKESQHIFKSTGGLHASGLFTATGDLILLREDVGRHNALDKLIGQCLLDKKLPLHHCILILSGRASFELIQKASMAAIPVVASVGAPSSLAVELAKENGMVLCGFVRFERMNVYTGQDKVINNHNC